MNQEIFETWKPIPGYTGYEVSCQGRVRTYRPINGRGGLTSVPRILDTPGRDKDGYVRICIRKDGKDVFTKVHKLVAEAFHSVKPGPEYQVLHGNGIRTDNRATNLRWGTALENTEDKVKHGTLVRKNS